MDIKNRRIDPLPSCHCVEEQCILCEGYLANGLAVEQVCAIRGIITHRSFTPHEILFREGFPSEYLFVIQEGYVKLSTMLPDGREQILQLGIGGHVLGIEALSDPTYEYTAEALTPTRVCRVRHADMLRILKENPDVSLHVIQKLNTDLERSRSLIRDLGLMSSTERMASFLLSLVPASADPGIELPLPLSRREIAEMLGLTVETASRVMAKMGRDGIIDAPRGTVRIQDLKKLRSLAGLANQSDPDRAH